MASASIWVASVRKPLPVLLGVVLGLVMLACSSPLDLSTDRKMNYADKTTNPTRISLLYYYGDSAIEFIYTDPEILKGVLIDTGATPFRVTIPHLQTPNTRFTPTKDFTPLVTEFSFGVERQPCDNVISTLVNSDTWFNVKHLTKDYTIKEYLWFADTSGRQFRLGLASVEEKRLVKGRIQISIADPDRPRFVNYNALVTLEY